MIVFDASTIVSAVLKAGSIPEQALLHALAADVLVLSTEVEREIASVLRRPKFSHSILPVRIERFLSVLHDEAMWFEPSVIVTDCRDAKDNKYLELALAAGAETLVSSDDDLLVLNPWREIGIINPATYLTSIGRVC